ncbi:MAG TPA: serine hydrolase [Chloroflexota bacterium]|nr:serine hydrolase [Chloroflexota bacterium]
MPNASQDVLAEAQRLIDEFSGRAGFFVHNLKTEETLGINQRETFPTASMIKLPILAELFRQVQAGQLNLDDRRTVRQADHVGGSGLLRHMTPGLLLPVRDLAYLMIAVSDNTATNLCIDLVGIDAVNRLMRELGCGRLALRNKIDFGHAWTEPDHLATGTPEDFVRLMAKVWRREILSPAACDEMLRMLAGVGADRAGRYLPINPYATEMAARGLDPGPAVQFAGKTGGLIGVRGQVAAVWNDEIAYVLGVMTSGSRDLSWGVDCEGSLLAARLGKLIYEYISRAP